MRPSASTWRMARPSAAVLTRKPSLASDARDEIADLAVVVDDQDVRSALHAGNIGEPRRKRFPEMCVELLPGRRLTNFVTKNPAPEKLEEISPLQWLEQRTSPLARELEIDMKKKALVISAIAVTTVLAGGWAVAQSVGHGPMGFGPPFMRGQGPDGMGPGMMKGMGHGPE